MIIEQIFSKQLNRDINGVVKAEQLDDDCVFVELDEYVITKELDRHFRHFFETYIPAIKNPNPAVAGKIGVWVSGFFVSGKSHFIKILSYLLENRTVQIKGQNRPAIDFFKDKINDAMLFGDIHRAVSKPTDVILFNIDSRANTDDGDNAILKVFNERVGYCADFPHIAHLERELDKRNQYQAFKDKFAELTGSSWESQRDAYDFYRDELAQSLAAASNQTIESTKQWVEQLGNNFPLDIRNFCKWVNEYLESHGDRNLLFLVDEVGQFIGQNTQMMLKLQTITEDLGTFCGGRAWVIVTSQADIEAAIGQLNKTSGEDFSKIQGRFYTRLQLSSSNTSEVIQKRLLEKTEPAAEAQVFAIGAKLTPKTASPSAMLEDAYRYVIENTFAKLNMLRLTPGEVTRELHSVMVSDDVVQLGIDMEAMECNPEATREIEMFITLKIERNEAIYLRDIINRYTRRPYGWPVNEILLLVARLGLAGKISFTMGASELPLKKAYDPFTSVRKHGEIRIQKVRQHDERQLKKAVALVKNLFNKTFTGTSEKELAELLKQEIGAWYDDLKSFNSKAQTGHFPGKQQIQQGLILLADLLQQSNSLTLIERCLEQNKLLEHFAEDFEDLDDFYKSQFQTWQALTNALNDLFKANRTALEKDPEAKKALDELDLIYNLASPYDQLRHINPLIEQIQKINKQLVLEKRQLAQRELDQRIERVQSALKQAGAPDDIQNKALRQLQVCKQRISHSESIPQIVSDQLEAAAYEDDAYELINRHIEALRQKEAPKPVTPTPGDNKVAEPAPKRTITISQVEVLNTVSPKGFIETENDIDRYLTALLERLAKAVNAGDRVRKR